MASTLFKLAGGLALLVGATLVQGQDIQERTIRFGHLNNTDHPTSWGVKKFGECVTPKSGGKITVKEFPSSQLGNELQQQSALQGGVQEMLVASTTSLTGVVKEFGLFDFPFLFSNAKQADAMVDGPLGKTLSAKLADKGILVLGFFDLGFRNVTNSKRPITKGEDLDGLKIRVIPNPVFLDTFKTFKANPLRDICTALELPDLSLDARFTNLEAQFANKPELQRQLRERFKTHTREHWLKRLEEQDLLCAPVRDMREVLVDPQTLHNQMILKGSEPGQAAYRFIASPIAMSAAPATMRRVPPKLGEHTDEVLSETVTARRT
jgi:hypothetical protein